MLSITDMKKVFLLVLLFARLLTFGQAPDQQTIPDFVLAGKSARELRLMRNEIFARYGYIFNSPDLADYFKSQRWYEPTYSNVDDQLTDIDKSNIERILTFENLAKQNPFNPSVKEESDAYFRVYTDPITGKRRETSRNVTFHDHYSLGKIRKVVERTFVGAEKSPTVVYAESIDHTKPYWRTTKYNDDIKFETNYFETIEYGCCGAENYGELFNYTSNEPILKFNRFYFTVDIPGSRIQMFVGYCHEHSGRDGSTIATLYLSTLDGVVSSITFDANNQKSKEDLPWYWVPKIELRTENEENKIIKNGREIRLWGSKMANALSDIGDFSIFIEFWSEGTGKKVPFNIPVTRGRFYGSNKKHSEITVNLD